MSTYILLPLHFLSPVHFGDASGGGGLDAVQPIGRADTFFSALCCEAARQGDKALQRLVEKTEKGEMTFSDLLPWYKRDGSYEWYVPKPVLSVPPQKVKEETLQEARNNSTFRKQAKKRAFIRASEVSLYIDDLRYGEGSLTDEPAFGTVVSQVHFNGKTRKPYSAGSYIMDGAAGLYSLIRLEKEEDTAWLVSLVEMVGLSGIGGRKSSGMGHFTIEGNPIILSEEEDNEDSEALYDMLEDREAEEQMTLSTLLPAAEEAEAAAKARGLWIQRSGLSWSQGMEAPVKMHTLYMLSSGSCLDRRLTGCIADVSTPAVNHPVYRYGKGLYVGVPK